MPICQICTEASEHVYGWICRRPELQEESITDWLLDNISTQTERVAYYPFSRHEEATISGADWDWWVLFGRSCFKLRIQAKRSRPEHDHYADIARANRNGLQIEMLINSSASGNFYPMYFLYGHACGNERCNDRSENSGIYVTSALEVYRTVIAVPRRSVRADDLHALCIPFHCLFCCPLVLPSGPEAGFDELFGRYFGYPRQPGDEEPTLARAESERPGYERETPSMILSLLEVRQGEKAIGIIREYRQMFRTLMA